MTLKIDNIQKTIDLMRTDNTIRMNMAHWIAQDGRDPNDDHWCGTTCCIAGFAIVSKYGKVVNPYGPEPIPLVETAREYLGINDEQAEQLFYAPTEAAWKITADSGIKLLEHLRDTGEVDWTIINPEFVPDIDEDE